MSETGTEIARIAALIQELGYRAQPGEDSIRTAMSGWAVLIFVWPGESIQMYLGFSLDAEDGFGLEQANEFNQAQRFIKCYVWEDTVRFEQDFYFNVSQPNAKEELGRIFADWEISIGFAQEALREAQRRYRERLAPSSPPS